jgi:gas vesicle protein
VRDWWRTSLLRERTRLRADGRATLLWSVRVTVAATASYVVATLIFPGTQPLLAPLTAMLVVQVTPVSLLASGLDRVLAVTAGVLVAVGFSVVVPLEWWSLGLLIFVSITIGQLLRLRANLVEVAISGMLVLGVGSLAAESAAWQRLTVTLVGAVVGIAANLLFPPRVGTKDAGDAIDQLADALGDLLTGAADDLTKVAARAEHPTATARAWLDESRRINHDIPRIGAALIHAEEGRKLNVRAVGRPDVGPGLRQGLEALEHSALAIRAMFRALADAEHAPSWEDREAAETVLLGLAMTFREMAAGLDAFGQLVHDEAVPGREPGSVTALREALSGLHEARARLDQMLVAGVAPDLLELHIAVLSTVKRLQRELDLAERIRRQIQLRPPRTRPRHPGGRVARPHPPTPPEPEPELGLGPDAETQPLPRIPEDQG